MALVVNGNNKTTTNNSVVDSTNLKKQLTPEQLKDAKSMYYKIRKSFLDNGCPITLKDQELAELIRLKILTKIIIEDI